MTSLLNFLVIYKNVNTTSGNVQVVILTFNLRSLKPVELIWQSVSQRFRWWLREAPWFVSVSCKFGGMTQTTNATCWQPELSGSLWKSISASAVSWARRFISVHLFLFLISRREFESGQQWNWTCVPCYTPCTHHELLWISWSANYGALLNQQLEFLSSSFPGTTEENMCLLRCTLCTVYCPGTQLLRCRLGRIQYLIKLHPEMFKANRLTQTRTRWSQ